MKTKETSNGKYTPIVKKPKQAMPMRGQRTATNKAKKK